MPLSNIFKNLSTFVRPMKIIIGADHGAFELKGGIKKYLASKKIKYEDVGTDSMDSVDYPDYAAKVAKKVQGTKNFGILMCGTGIGMCMAANKFKGIRAALCYDEYTAGMAREHNDANILCMGGRTTKLEDAKRIIGIFLSSSAPSAERHQRRVGKLSAIEKNNFK